jgi:PAS domain S-box-containing protein
VDGSTTAEDLKAEIGALRTRLQEAEETLRAISGAEVDAFLMNRADTKKVYLLQYADMPYRILLERMNEGALTINGDGIILYSNGFLARLLALGGERAVGESFYDFILPEHQDKLRSLIQEAKRGSSRGELVLKATDGKMYEFQLSIAPFLLEELPDAFCVIATDLAQRRQVEEALQRARDELEEKIGERTAELVEYREHLEELVAERTKDLKRSNERLEAEVAERKNKEEQLQAATEQLRALALRVESVRDDERRRISSEVHDELGQALTGLKMNLSFVTKNLDDRELSAKLESMIELVDATLDMAKHIAIELHPSTMELGIGQALESYCRQLREISGIEYAVVSNIDQEKLGKDISMALFRIAREAFANIIRHADATRIGVSLVSDKDDVVLEINDNGRGATEEELDNRKSLGILGMKEQARSLNGDCLVFAEKDGGTRVVVRIPFNNGNGS